jgi:hypothetical protein
MRVKNHKRHNSPISTIKLFRGSRGHLFTTLRPCPPRLAKQLLESWSGLTGYFLIKVGRDKIHVGCRGREHE